MKTERYHPKYEQDIIKLINNFYEESLEEYVQLDMGTLFKTIDDLKEGAFLLIVNDKCEGALAGREVASPISSEKVWQEVIWYINPTYRHNGIRLLNETRKILKEEGYNYITMVNMANSKADKLERLYSSLGFSKMETHWIGRL